MKITVTIRDKLLNLRNNFIVWSDTETYISSVYQTQRGWTNYSNRRGIQNEYLNDVIVNNQSLTDVNEMIRMVDIDYQHQPEFFDTMVAKLCWIWYLYLRPTRRCGTTNLTYTSGAPVVSRECISSPEP